MHQRLTLATSHLIPASEETITETLLLDLAVALGGHLQVTPFTKYRESRKPGADWEWWFCDGVYPPMFGMRVQAKKLKIKSGTPSYDFAYKPRLSMKRQVDRLIEATDREGVPAVYALYNGPELDLDCFQWRCCTEPQSADVFGVSPMAAETGRRQADSGDMSLTQAGALSRPWSCVALCHTALRMNPALPFWPDADGDLSLYAADLVSDLMAQEAAARDRSTRQAVLRAARGYRPWDESPRYAQDLVVKAASSPLERFEREDNIELPRGIAGVAVFTTEATSSEPPNMLQ